MTPRLRKSTLTQKHHYDRGYMKVELIRSIDTDHVGERQTLQAWHGGEKNALQ